MLRLLRLRLGLLYLAASLGLVALMGGTTYGLLTLYFQRSTDLALQYKMAIEFQLRNLPLSPALVAAEQTWFQENNHQTGIKLAPTATIAIAESDDTNEDSGQSGTSGGGQKTVDEEDRYDSRLAPVFVLAGMNSTPVIGVPVVNDPAAITAAQQAGSDVRTIRLKNGTRLRLLTYMTEKGSVLQVGRMLSDQDRLLAQYLTGLLVLGSIASLLLALASWVLAGRSIKPAQRAWDQQSQFIANASHELRAPLTLLRANADYALHDPSVVERERSLRDIVDECDYMNRLVEDLLLLSRLDAGRLGLVTELVQVPDLLEQVTRQVKILAADCGVAVELLPSAGQVRADPDRLRQVLLILLDNAMRFTPSGGNIRLESRRHGREVEILVVDTGAGIPAEALPHMFERFYQVPGQPQEGRGNGLGLSIARSLVEAHHGHIKISSQPGQGTTVQILLPAAEK
jgi:signal transduction histidine kinase